MEGKPTPIDPRTWSSINELAIAAHEARSVGDLQAVTFRHLRSIIPYRAAMFDLCEGADGGSICYREARADGMSALDLERYYAEYAAQDYTTWRFNSKDIVVYRDLDIVEPRIRDSSPIYLDWMAPQDLYYGCGATLVHHRVLRGTITLFRSIDAGEFDETELEALRQVSRHLSIKLEGMIDDMPGVPIEMIGADLARRYGLSQREAETLDLMLRGQTNGKMAQSLCISESTLKKHVNAIYRQMGIRNRAELARRAIDLLIENPWTPAR
ncbi:MAG: LuxR C-terminal-related transcriptional regulator [Collinsella sp.]|nr:LuxR C-terminal-related transcriptional regulator [Collinsella sp.]